MPFWPGGFDDISLDPKTLGKEAKGLRSIPPGFSRGLHLPGDPLGDEELITIEGEETRVLDETHDMVYHVPHIETMCCLSL